MSVSYGSERSILRTQKEYVWKRASLLANLTIGVMKEGSHQPIETNIRQREKRKEEILKRYDNEHHKLSVETDCYTNSRSIYYFG